MTLATDLNQPSTEAALSVLAASGWSLRSIAREWDLPYGKLRYHADKYGIEFSRRVSKNALPVNPLAVQRTRQMRLADAAAELGVSRQTVMKWRRHNISYPPQHPTTTPYRSSETAC